MINAWKDRQKQKEEPFILDDTFDIDEVEMEDVSYGEKLTVLKALKYDSGDRDEGIATTMATSTTNVVLPDFDSKSSITSINGLENSGSDNIFEVKYIHIYIYSCVLHSGLNEWMVLLNNNFSSCFIL